MFYILDIAVFALFGRAVIICWPKKAAALLAPSVDFSLRLKIVDKYFYEICCKIRKKCIFAEIGRKGVFEGLSADRDARFQSVGKLKMCFEETVKNQGYENF